MPALKDLDVARIYAGYALGNATGLLRAVDIVPARLTSPGYPTRGTRGCDYCTTRQKERYQLDGLCGMS